MKRSELKAGMLLKLRNGDIYTVVDGVVKYNDCHEYIDVTPLREGFSRLYITNNLLALTNSQFDVVRVYKIGEIIKKHECVFERVDVITEGFASQISGTREEIDAKMEMIANIVSCKNINKVVIVEKTKVVNWDDI